MEWPSVLSKLAASIDLSREEARDAMTEVMAGTTTPAQIAAFILALRMKGETVEEMTGLVEAIRSVAVAVDVGDVDVVDVVGTGGDGTGTFNVSTTASLIAAGAGARVAKHGNRSASSRCGSADVLEALGVRIDLTPAANVVLLRETGYAFFFAPLYHPSFRHAGPVRRELGIPTVFNFLGPLANPARARRHAIGVSDPRMAERMMGVLERLDSVFAFVFYGEDGLDEITTSGPSYIYRLRNGEVTHAEFTPEDFGIARSSLDELKGGDAVENADIVRAILGGEPGPKRDAALINTAPALVAAGVAPGFLEAMELARASIDSGAAAAVLERVVARSAELAEP